MNEVMLRATNIKMHFPISKGLLFKKQVGAVKAVDGVSLELRRGETLGLVGESGCGKSTLGRCLIRLYNPTAGSIEIAGKDITTLNGSDLRAERSQFQMIFQDPYASLNPRMTVFDIIAEPIKTHGIAPHKDELRQMVNDLMLKVGLSPRFVRKYPHEFSGGQRQRIAVARALAVRPKIIVCDEPVSALDVSIQAQILNLLKDLQAELQISYIFIAHDLAAVKHISDRIAVMYLGKIVEQAPRDELFANPQHPYTRALLSAIPVADPKQERQRERILLKGDLPSPINPPSGCTFHTRCPHAIDICRSVMPSQSNVGPKHIATCHLLDKGTSSH
jgi:oligopeptide transport system ATP-binding protein